MKQWQLALVALAAAAVGALPAAAGQEQTSGSPSNLSSTWPTAQQMPPRVVPTLVQVRPVIDPRPRLAAATVTGLIATVRAAADAHRPPLAGPPAAPGQPGQCAGRVATLTGTERADDLWGTPGRDVIDAGDGDDWIRGLAGDDLICAGDGNDFVFAGAGEDVVYGQGGNDLVEGRPGDDRIDGGPGMFDAATFWSSPGGVVASLADGTATGPHGTDTFTNVEGLHGSDHSDTFYGSSGEDGLLGLGGDDLLVAGDGNDRLHGYAGDDRLVGGDGNDWLTGDDGNDEIDGGPGPFDGAGYFGAGGPVTASLTTNSATGLGTDTFNGIEVLGGGPHDDRLEGGPTSQGLIGEDGDDTLAGGSAGEFLLGGDGNDWIDGRGGNNWLRGGPGDDTLQASTPSGWNTASYWDAPAGVSGGFGSGTVTGEGTDTLGPGLNTVQGSPFADSLTGGAIEGTGLQGENGDDSLTGGPANEFLMGGPGNDTIQGGPGNDWMPGGAGDDSLAGGQGAFDTASYFDATSGIDGSLVSGTVTGFGTDVLGDGVEVLQGGPHHDTLRSSGGFDKGLQGEDGDDLLIGGPVGGFLMGGLGNDTIQGGSGHEWIAAGAGDDTIDGGEGWDTSAYFDAPGPVSADLASGIASGAAGDDTLAAIEGLDGGEHGDTLTGNGSSNSLHGLGGNDDLRGGAGDDFVNGGAGNDSLRGEDGFDSLIPGSGADTVDGGAGIGDLLAYLDAPGPIMADLGAGSANGDGADTFMNVEQVHGSNFADTLSVGTYVGAFFYPALIGNGGDDTLTGGPGNDTLSGVAGDDTITGAGGDDFLVLGSGSDTVDGGPGANDTISFWDAAGPIHVDFGGGTATGDGLDAFVNVERVDGGEFDDTLVAGTSFGAQLGGGGGNDTITGGAGNDILSGNAGDDLIAGAGGDDLFAPGAGTDTVDGGAGYDGIGYWDSRSPIMASLVTGTATGDGPDAFSGIESIHGSDFGDALVGGSAGDTLYGNRGDDSLYGGPGDDQLDGGEGIDFVDGGPDWDNCHNAETRVNCEGP
jgi:Ca2+-binding RTX toxin-like protein